VVDSQFFSVAAGPYLLWVLVAARCLAGRIMAMSMTITETAINV